MARYYIDNRDAPIDFECGGDQARRALQNAKNLLMCHMGEVPFDRLRGFDPALYDLPIGRFREEMLPELDRVMQWEPDVEIVDAEATIDSEGIYIRATVEVNIEE